MSEKMILNNEDDVKDYIAEKLYSNTNFDINRCFDLSKSIIEEILCNVSLYDNLKTENDELKEKLKRIEKLVNKLLNKVEA